MSQKDVDAVENNRQVNHNHSLVGCHDKLDFVSCMVLGKSNLESNSSV